MRRLILRPGAIGDCLLSFPALEYLQATYTEIWISSPVLPLIDFADRVRSLARTGIDNVGLSEEEMPDALRNELEGFDQIVSWYGANRPLFRGEMERLRVPCRFYAALPPGDYPGHTIDFFAGQVGAPAGLTPRIRCPDAPRHDAVVIHPFSGSARKNWPLERYRELAGRLQAAVVWTAGPEESLAGARRFEDLSELAEFLAGASLFIGNDTGISHLAAAAGTPTLALFGPTDPKRWAPRGAGVTVLHCDPLAELPVGTVLDAANRLLGCE